MKKKKLLISFFKEFGKMLWFIIKLPYLIISSITKLIKKISKNQKEYRIERKRSSIKANYRPFKILKTYSGNSEKWENKIIKSDSAIGIVLGARGSGKSAFGAKLIENIYAKAKKKCYAIGFLKEEMPSWIEVIESTKEIKNNSCILIDEGGVLFSARKSMTNANKMLSDLILISRHKNISIIFISQNSSNLDINIIRQADYLVLKKSSLLQKDFERKKVKDIYSEIEKDFSNIKDKSTSYIYADEFKGFISNPLPSFWSEKVSKSFK